MTDDAHPNQEYADRLGSGSGGETIPQHVSPAELQAQQAANQGGATSTAGQAGTVPGTLRDAGSEELSEDELRQFARDRKIDDSGSVDELRARLTGTVETGEAPEAEPVDPADESPQF